MTAPGYAAKRQIKAVGEASTRTGPEPWTQAAAPWVIGAAVVLAVVVLVLVLRRRR